MDKILIIMTSGPDTPRRCATPFFFATPDPRAGLCRGCPVLFCHPGCGYGLRGDYVLYHRRHLIAQKRHG